MSGETSITIVGNACNDPELRFLSNGTAVANITVASSPRSWDKSKQEWVDGEPLFMRCSIWREMAEHVAESIVKGSRVIVTGRLKQRSYEKDNEKRTVVELDVEEIGPSLRYAQAKVSKAGKKTGGGSTAPATDPWGNGDEPPF